MINKGKGIGGIEVPLDVNESISEIPQNKTLIAQKLTNEAPAKAELVQGIKSIDEAFDHFKPECEVAFENIDGVEVTETLKFNNLGDFASKGITRQSDYLNELNLEQEQLQRMIKQLKTNKILKSLLQEPEAKNAFLNSLQSLINELEQS